MALFAALTVPDMIVLGLVVVLAVRGAIKGFTWQLIRTAGLVGAIFVAGLLDDGVGVWIHERFDSWVPDKAEQVVAWVAVFFVAWLIVTFVAFMGKGAVAGVNLTGVDRVLGLGLGAVMGVVLATVLFVAYGHIVPNTDLEDTLDESISARYMAVLIDTALPLVPDPLKTEWSETLDEIRGAGEAGESD